jgi:hypothetical protein
MTDAAAIAHEMQSITRRAAEPWLPGDSVKAAIGRASRTLGIGYRCARSFWYGETVSVRAFEADQMRAAELALLSQRQERLRHELALITARLDAADEADARKAADKAQQKSDRAQRKAGSGRQTSIDVGEKP